MVLKVHKEGIKLPVLIEEKDKKFVSNRIKDSDLTCAWRPNKSEALANNQRKVVES